jgi:PadR family transcriptional regulator, regulatory protein PadR
MDHMILKKIYLGFLQTHVLYHASIEPIYGLFMIQELNHHGYHVGPSHIYPLLNQMEKQGLLNKEEKNEFGKIRKYYQITQKGTELLNDIKIKVRELSNEILEKGNHI